MENLFDELNNMPQELCKKCAKCCISFNCKNLDKNNLCSVYENRPEICKDFPFSPWQEVPEGCGYEGWLFLRREKQKQQIRKLKELLLSIEVMLKTASEEESEKLKGNIEKIKKSIDIFAKYGSWDW